MTSTATRTAQRTSGWVTFVGVYLGVAGVLNLLWGIAAVTGWGQFAEHELVLKSLEAWGGLALLLGAAQIAGALLIRSRRSGGPMIAGYLAFLGLMVNFLSIGAYPIWSAILLAVDALILWAVTVHSDEFI